MRPSETSSFDAEYVAIRSGRAVVELAGWSSISVTGADRKAFLHNFCTNDVKRLVPGASCEAFFTNVKGKITGHGLIQCRESELAFIGAPGQGPRLVEHLDRYVIREDVAIRDTSAERRYVLVAGGLQAETSHELIVWDIIRRAESFLVECRPQELETWIQNFALRGFVVGGLQSFETVRIEARFPLFGVDFDDHNLPQEVGRDHEAISFTKGCYLGQETVARIDALGHVNQQIVQLKFSGSAIPPAGSEVLMRGTAVGRVTSSTFSPQFGAPLALAMVRREALAPGTQLDSSVGNCEVIAGPADQPTD